MVKSRFAAAAYLVLMFLSGVVFGGFAYRLYSAKAVSATTPRKLSPAEFRQQYVEEIRTKVKLDNDQVSHLNQIMDETKTAVDELNARRKEQGQAIYNVQVDKINAILREDQRPLYTQFRADREKRRKEQQKHDSR
jgi:hypothetical protein